MHLNSNTPVYLTGGTGFIGLHLRSALADRQVPVTLLVREGRTVETRETEQIQHGDITTPESLLVEGHDIIVHLAAQTSIKAAVENPRSTWKTNADGTLNILEAAQQSKVSRFLYASTASVYGVPTHLPIDESHPVNPAEPYGASKLAGDGLTRSFNSCYDLDTVVARMFNTFGYRQPSHNVVSTIISQALTNKQVELGNLTSERDFIYIDDVVSGLTTILERGKAGTPYNVGCGEAVSIGEIAEMVVETVGRDVKVVSADIRQRSDDIEIPKHVADSSRLRDLGWKPRYDVRQGITETVDQKTE